MFINGAALGVALWLLTMALVLLTGVLIAHLVWLTRLARGPALAGSPVSVRWLIVAAAVVTPVLSFYASEIAALWHRRTAGETVTWRRLGIVAAPTVALAAAGALSEEARYLPEYRTWSHTARTFAGLLRLVPIAQGLLYMILRVFSAGRRPMLIWLTFPVIAARLVFLLIGTPADCTLLVP
ncbi:hypothetical protein [Methylobacterium sp. AMS5]|uniref:hypothetical protein n=1 Tax=Methylobacterium sp. AMS5 TaxID=925818 RepID=UPI00074FA94B|nr:hypothetical protein [Methylobacterium sp. AMS5]AMB43825.1 hypothetical protein Y590_02910 [Methylobacterium sp. AMS5]